MRGPNGPSAIAGANGVFFREHAGRAPPSCWAAPDPRLVYGPLSSDLTLEGLCESEEALVDPFSCLFVFDAVESCGHLTLG